MNPVTVIIGVGILMFGLYNTVMRYTRPEKLCKLEALKDLFGDKMGNLLHLITYTAIPFFAGGIFVFSGLKGTPVF